MSKITVHMSKSLDGFIAGPNPAPENLLGSFSYLLAGRQRPLLTCWKHKM